MKSSAAGPARTQLPLLPFRRGSYLHVEGSDGISWQGGPRQQTGSPVKTQRAEEASFGDEAGTQHAGCLLILIGASVSLVTPSFLPWRGPKKARGVTLAEPMPPPPHPAPWEAVKLLIAVWSPAATLPPLLGLAVTTCWARSEAKRIRALAWVQDPCLCAMIFQQARLWPR